MIFSKLKVAPTMNKILTVRNPGLRVKQFDHPSFMIFLLAQVIPSMLGAVGRDVALPNIVRLHDVGGSKISFAINGPRVAETQGPFFDGRN